MGGVKLTKEEFVAQLKKVHPEYDYSVLEYAGSKKETKYVKFICPKHGIKSQLTVNHLYKGCGCDECGKEKAKKSQTIPKEEFVERCREIFGDEYEYIEYTDTKAYMTVKHKQCGNIYKQIAGNHLYAKNGCPFCYGKFKITQEEFLERAKEFQETIDFSEAVYTNMESNVKLRCKVCGTVFYKMPLNMLRFKQGCPKCAKKYRYNAEEFIKEAKKVNGDKYTYDNLIYINSKTKITITCPKHGNFEQLPNNHLRGHGCPKCYSSRGEDAVREYLINNNILFEEQKSFEGLVYKGKLRYDFYLPEYRMAIEYNGIQHYKAVDYFGGEVALVRQKRIDGIKKRYAEDNGFRLLTISYEDDTIKALEGALGENKIDKAS